jgi:uncharacterized protein (DUF2147 family)
MRRDAPTLIKFRYAPCLCALWLLLSPVAAQSAEITGQWITEGGKSHVNIDYCGIELCGKIVWLKDPLNEEGQPKHDMHNPDPSLRKREVVGMKILEGFVQDGGKPGRWVNGSVYDPESGRTYACTMAMQGGATLEIRGYVGIPLFGKSTLRTRLSD